MSTAPNLLTQHLERMAAAVRARLDAEWIRRPDLDRRIRRGDDFAGDAWQRGDELRYTAPGHRP